MIFLGLEDFGVLGGGLAYVMCDCRDVLGPGRTKLEGMLVFDIIMPSFDLWIAIGVLCGGLCRNLHIN